MCLSVLIISGESLALPAEQDHPPPAQHLLQVIPIATKANASQTNATITTNISSSGSSEAASVEENIPPVNKPAAVKFANADGQPADHQEISPEEFRDPSQIQRREKETHEQLLRLAEEREKLRSSCFHVPEEFCEFKNFTAAMTGHQLKNLCPCKPHPFEPLSIVCCNVTDIREARVCYNRQYGSASATANSLGQRIHIRNATLNELNMANVWWKNFDRIAVTDGAIRKLSNSFTHMMRLNCLNVSNNNVTEIDHRIFKSVLGGNFTVLDLSQNNLTAIPNVSQFDNLSVNVRNNSEMHCKVLRNYVNDGVNFAERNHSFCRSNLDMVWFKDTNQIQLTQLYLDKALKEVCPKMCKCVIANRYITSQVSKQSNLSNQGFCLLTICFFPLIFFRTLEIFTIRLQWTALIMSCWSYR